MRHPRLVRCLGVAWGATALALIVAGSAEAETVSYRLDVPEGQTVRFTLDLEVRHTGPLTVEASWSGRRTLALKLEPPSAPFGSLLRAGPSPQRLEAEVGATALGTWRLEIHALAARDRANGNLTVRLPEPAPPQAPQPVEPSREPDFDEQPWLRPRVAAEPVPRGWLTFLDAVERFRGELAASDLDGPADACRWQAGLMRFLAEHRDRLLDRGPAPPIDTITVLARIAEAVEVVERMRTSRDPLLSGPPPADPALENAWEALRGERVRAVEGELDLVLELVERGHAPELEQQHWPTRLVSCVAACERYFDQRVRVGEERATNRELARAQWSRVLLAAEALEALTRLHAADAPR